MKVTFPDMGSGFIFDKLFRMAGHDVIHPPTPSKDTLSIGVLILLNLLAFLVKSLWEAILKQLKKELIQ